jgi:hypothetical protein
LVRRAKLPIVLAWHTPNLTNTWNAGWRSLESLVGKQDSFEGCFDNIGSCPMNCTHVWNYEQSLADLYPALEHGERDTNFKVNTREEAIRSRRICNRPVLVWRLCWLRRQ